MISSTERFSNRVDYYVRARPRYPAALLRFFQSELALSPAQTVADIGSGTGFLTELFVRNGNQTYAVEPNGPMRAAAERFLGEWSNFHSIVGTAEKTTLPDASIDLLTAGQSFHWFDPKASAVEFRRVLRGDGVVALVWNERMIDGSEFMIAYDNVIQNFRDCDGSARPRLSTAAGDQNIRVLFGSSPFRVAKFENTQVLDRAGLIDRIVSSSNMPLAPDPRHEKLLAELNNLFDAHQENSTVRMLHETWVYYGTLA